MSNVFSNSDFTVVGIMKTKNASDAYAGATVFYQKSGASAITYLSNADLAAADVDHQARFEANVVPHIAAAITQFSNFTTTNSAISVDSYSVQGVKS
mgnify:FL=1|jgi:hypothetical protein|tara:strand:- start:151 stop:441 length:291 start_codon:yes stop_codon:yes gene_type:complete